MMDIKGSDLGVRGIEADQVSEIRTLKDAELDAVNGGILPVLIGIGLFAGGFTVGCILANYKMTGNFGGDIE
jgi:lactobin A/cerein 7B family class IIb bacteriocin